MIRIRRLLYRDLLSLVGVAMLVLLASAWWSAAGIMESQAKAQAGASLQNLEREIRSRLENTEQVGESLVLLWKRGLLAPVGSLDCEKLLHAVLRVHPEISNFVIASTRGEGTSANVTEGQVLSRRVDNGPRGPVVMETAWDDFGVPIRSGVAPIGPIDWSERPWFKLAKTSRRGKWTDPYIYVNPPVPGVTYTTPLLDREGRFQGALAVDLRAEEFSQMLWKVQPTPHSQVILLDRSGRVLGLPQLATFEGIEARRSAFLRPVGPDFLPVAHAIRAAPEPARSIPWPRLTVDGADYFVQHRSLEGTGWELILAIPVDDLLREPRRKALLFLGLGLATCGLLVWRLRRTAEQVSAPLAELAEGSDALVRGEAIGLPRTEIYEVLHAAQAFQAASRVLAEKRQLEEQLRHTQRLELLGTMASGIAHDVNNQLAAVIGQLDLARIKAPASAEQQLHLEKAEQAAAACAEITNALLTFGRPTKPQVQAVNLNDLVRTTADLLSHVRRRNVRIEMALAESEPRLLGEPVQLQQVLMNLGLNGKDAMPDGGTLTFTTGAEKGMVWVRVSDTGTGMSGEVKEKIFTPFFTTKGEGQGSGLGLAMVFGIVKAHSGEIDIVTAEGQGTSFTLSFKSLLQDPGSPG